MVTYIARYENVEYNLGSTAQLDKMLEKGANLYAYENGNYTLIATPESGYLVDKPIIPIVEVVTGG